MKRTGKNRGQRIAVMLSCGAILLGGCRVGPDYVGPPSAAVPCTYTQTREAAPAAPIPTQVTEEAPIDCAELAYWWQNLGDPTLDSLVRQAVSQNLTLKEAALRICEGRAKLGTVRSGLFPQIDADGSYYYQKRSASSGGTGGFGSGVVDATNELWSSGLNMSWEIDVFGRLKRLVEAADADIAVDVELYRNTLILLLSDVARNYVQARAYQQRMAVVEQNIRAQQRTLDITEAKFPATVSELDTAQARANLMSSKAEMPGLQLGYREAINRLSVLLGAPIGQVDALMQEVRPIPRAPQRIATGIPAELLRRRPDIRQAERQVAAQTARIGAAVGDLYPMFSLTGTFGLDAQNFSQVFQSDSLNAGIGPSVRWNILNFGKYTCNIEAQKFIQQQLIASYQETVLQAAEEVDNSLAGYQREQQRYAYLAEAVASYQRAVEVSQKRYEQGTTDFQRVLDSQRSLLNYQNQLVQSEANVVNYVILLYRALGGGWQMPIHEAPPMPGGPGVPGVLNGPVAPAPPFPPNFETIPLPQPQP